MGTTLTVVTMKYHGPGWEIVIDPTYPGSMEEYQLWAPGTSRDGRVREHWAAHWQSPDGVHGGHKRGQSAEVVLEILPEWAAGLFRPVIETWEAEQ